MTHSWRECIETLLERVRCIPQLAQPLQTLSARVRCTPQLALAHELLNPVLNVDLEDLHEASWNAHHQDHGRECRRSARRSALPAAARRGRAPAQSRPVCRSRRPCGSTSNNSAARQLVLPHSPSQSTEHQSLGEGVLPELGRVRQLVPPPRPKPSSCPVGRNDAYTRLGPLRRSSVHSGGMHGGVALSGGGHCVAINVHHQPLEFQTRRLQHGNAWVETSVVVEVVAVVAVVVVDVVRTRH